MFNREAALKIEPGDKIITKQLNALRSRQRKAGWVSVDFLRGTNL